MDSSVVKQKRARKKKKSFIEGSSNEISKKKYSTSINMKSQDSNITNIQNFKKHSISKESLDQNVVKKLKKKISKTRNVDTKSEFIVKTEQLLKTKKLRKTKNISCNNVQHTPSTSKDLSVSAVVKNASNAKKRKKKLKKASINEEDKSSDSDFEFSDYCTSEDNESDEEVLREEIQNSSVFQKIKKLMQKAPHLNPAFEGSQSAQHTHDEDEDTSEMSCSVESGNEDSSTESDDQDDSRLKNKTACEKQNSPKRDKNFVSMNKKSSFVEKVIENTAFKHSAKDNLLKRTVSDQGKKSVTSTNLKNKVQEKLAGAKFRFLNEKLYTETGKEAFKYFQENKEEFEDYHSGYRLQVSKWPINPVNEIIADIQKLKKSIVIADFGCGEAKIAQTFPDRIVHSFDLVPMNEYVKACDISKVPLPNESADVAVFCLSLMGTNLKDYLSEAFRILKIGGLLKIAEVESRIEDLGHFINYLKSMGFTVERKNTKHKMFIFLDLKKAKQKCKLGKLPSLSLRPCLYKKR